MKLPPIQVAVLEAASADEPTDIDDLAAQLEEKPETVTGAAFALEEAGLLSVTDRTETQVSLTEEGATYATDGLPEVRLYEAAIEAGAADEPVPMGEVLGAAALDGPAVDIALSNFARKGYGSIDSGQLSATPEADPADDEEAQALKRLAAGESLAEESLRDRLASRNLIEVTERTRRAVTLTEAGVTELMAGVEATERVDRLTPAHLQSGEWEAVTFAEYNVEAAAETPTPGKRHVLRQTAKRVKEVLVGMGFQEMAGPHVDADFWINDCLFMPQDHPARTHWDRFALENPRRIDELPEDLLERVERAHREGVGEDGEGYHSPWSRDFAAELALRGHTTSLSARYLSGEQVGELEPPQRYFSVEKAYRNDTLDATHLLEFFQIEGWVMAEDLTVRDLMGTFREFYSQFGITDLQFKPTYNPYTEPSFELFGRHPETDELIEIGNSGIFRPEMLEPLGVEADVMAWGLALERLLMLITGFEDIRDVHGTLVDLDFLRGVEVEY
ncbi:phenylalanine--tRNA ligase subunit alpha [Halodesulfurarchaeum formicicum]|uniref:Phenylalanine--tRNA ligase alpha subunit n=1 Tax=Halodesulfurarchaeum formicicum TaxID=1873524 RepID=A0A1J1A978_9EURY|nr:phenylalanine--tRNA ligase subunit alpha [Halodesulfurarchaeum formicicum]APE94658.1 phenylalanyl-tRNA synthetase subunit alpha [Halodesulfurarchaeum formicicum]